MEKPGIDEPKARTFYRTIRSNPPTLQDFMSYKELGRPLRSPNPTSSQLAAWQAISTYATESLARKRAEENRALGFPLGAFIAKLFISEDAPITIGTTNDRTGHAGLTGDPAVLLAAVVSVVRV